MSNQKFSNQTLLYPFNQDIYPDYDNIRDIGSPTRRFKHIHTGNLTTSFFSTSSSIVDSMIFDIANQDVRLFRPSTKTLALDDNSGGPAKLLASEFLVGDSSFNLSIDTLKPRIEFDGGDFMEFDRASNCLTFKIANNPNPDFQVENGVVTARTELRVADALTFIRKEISGPAIHDVRFQFHTDNWMYWDHSTTKLSTYISSQEIVKITPAGLFASSVDVTLTGDYKMGGYVWSDWNRTNRSVRIGNPNGSLIDSSGYGLTLCGDSAGAYSISGSSRNSFFGGRCGNGGALSFNCGFGFETFQGSNASNCSVMGCQSFQNVTGDNNTGIGFSVGNNLISGTRNTLLGKSSDVASATQINSSTLGDSAIVQTDHSCQIGDRVDNGSGILSFHTQDVHNENFVDGNVGLIINDQLGSNSKEGLYISHEYINTFGNGTDVSTSCRIRFRRVGDSISVVFEGCIITATVADAQVFGDVLDIEYRPAYTLSFPILCTTGAVDWKQLKITTAGSISLSELGSSGLSLTTNVFSANGFSYAL